MKTMKAARFIFFVTLLAAGFVELARWLHPATFPLYIHWWLLIVAFASAAVIILSHD